MILGHGEKVTQEFYCRHCPCDDPASKDPDKLKTGGHFRVKFNVGYDATIKIHCPKCGHVHDRHVKGGVIFDGGGGGYTDEVRVPKSAWSRDPFTKKAAEAKQKAPTDDFQAPLRGDNVIRTAADLSEAAKAVAKSRLGVLQIYEPGPTDGGPQDPNTTPEGQT